MFDDWGEAQVDTDILKREYAYREKAIKDYKICLDPIHPNFDSLSTRTTEVLFQGFQENPQSIFMFEFSGRRVVGKKYMSDLCITYGIPSTFLFCSLVKGPMLLGLVEREQVMQDGVLVFFKPFTGTEKGIMFRNILDRREIDIYYPYTQLLTEAKLEKGSPSEGWAFDPKRGKVMLMSEVEQRRHTVEVLGPLLKEMGKNQILFDPACSAGVFLAHVQMAYPNVVTVGQDLSPSMVHEATKILNQVFLGDSIETPVMDESADVIFFRFLNVEVVTSEMAYNLLHKLVRKSKVGGYVIVFGYSPVLVSLPAMTRMGLKMIQANGVTNDREGLFQYYVLQRQNGLRDTDFESISGNEHIYGPQ